MLRLLRVPFQAGLGAALGPAPGCTAAMLALLRVPFFQDWLARMLWGFAPRAGKGPSLGRYAPCGRTKTSLPLLPPVLAGPAGVHAGHELLQEKDSPSC
jgi:hypothetical protein